MLSVKRRCINLLQTKREKQSYSYIEDDYDGFYWSGDVRCSLEFNNYKVIITLTDLYQDSALDQYAIQKGLDYNVVDEQDLVVNKEIDAIAQEEYFRDIKTVKGDLEGVLRYLKRSKFITHIYLQPCEEIGVKTEVLYKKQKNSKKELDKTLVQLRQLKNMRFNIIK